MNFLFCSSVIATLLIGPTVVLKAQERQAPAVVSPTEAQAASGAATERYRVRQGDSLELTFPFVPAFNQTVTVQPDGYVVLRHLGEVQAAGQTVRELESGLASRYATILRDPVMTIVLRDFEKPYFIASGEVERPGKYELRGETTVAQALAIAGGLRERGKRSQVLVFRSAPEDGMEVKEFDLKKVMNRGLTEEDFKLNHGDMVFVPKRRAPPSTLWMPFLSALPWLIRF
jgi:polysaccharide export outer membrane protein